MKPKQLPPDDPREWIRRANSNLALSGTVLKDVDFADLCFDAQQAAEKSIKAVFIHRSETFPYTHDIEKLIRLLERNGLKVPKYVQAAKELTRFAHKTRYPGMGKPVTRSEYRRAVRIATAVVRWAEKHIGQS
ncbi:MAG TPA: DNA-binding protein [Planctomycetales bacterium]|jgi:HEPN domain-containing protein|nr:DNA-binding protein [Planctomycetales bacterium]